MRQLLCYLPLLCTALPLQASEQRDLAQQVLPLLQKNCWECHGADTAKADLRLHEAQAVSKADLGELLRRIKLPRSDREAMPKRGKSLSPAEIQLLEAWVQKGSPWAEGGQSQQHWSYLPPKRSDLPANSPEKNPVDAFVHEERKKASLEANPEAEPAVLYRRLCLDLTGLPPSLEKTDRFMDSYAKGADTAVQQAVDELLRSEEFGVRWARPWLDAARYADSHGFQRDDLREIWAFRDWVIQALNANMPFDQFTIEQVAGDLLPNPTPAQIIATGFHRCTPTNVEAGTEPEESRINQVLDRVNTTGTVWLGTTLECAQCHDHKYDPFSQKDYYSLLAFFNNTEKEAERSNPKIPGSIKFDGVSYKLAQEETESKKQAAQAQIQKLQEKKEALLKSTAAAAPPRKQPQKAEAPNASSHALKAASIDTESGTEFITKPDQSILFIGTAPETDTYTLEYENLPSAPITGLLIETLSDENLPGKGPGRGSALRPNFVLDHLEASTFTPNQEKISPTPLKFQKAYASHSQPNFPVQNLADADPATGWAINPRFGISHWAALQLQAPLSLPAGTQLRLKLVQNFGGARTIGRLKVSVITGNLLAALPSTEEEQETARPGQSRAINQIDKQIAATQKTLTNLNEPTTEVMRELPQPRMTSIFKRGVYTALGEQVKPATPAILPQPKEQMKSRLDLAKWLVSRDNPLTARVTVNRWWAELFGAGLVSTVEDFGIKGLPPTHPRLLDWLAVEFMDSGWNMKHILKLIVTSKTYRQSSSLTLQPHALKNDPENHLLWHGPRHRMDAEMIRDNALTISGLLSTKKGGPPIRPPQPEGLWAKVGGQQYDYQVSPGAEKNRRGIYVVLKRGSPYPSFVNFDASARNACVVKRSRSNTPLQALTLLNDPVFVEAAQAFAARIEKEKPAASLESQLEHAFRLALSRKPRPTELQVLTQLYHAQAKKHTPKVAWQAVTTAILNLDETITKG